MNSTVKLFDANNKLVTNFDEEIEKILMSIHGEKYYDVDEDFVNTNKVELETPAALENVEVTTLTKETDIQTTENKRISIRDFIPVLFFILIFAVIVIAGYYFLNTVDLISLIGAAS